jgi:DNA invertase Pin-like site-specific DNA recombinase
MTTTAETMTGREYLRVSADKSGYERSNDDQHDENADVAADSGITLGTPYRDVGSASRFATKVRDGFGQLMADLETDAFGADVLILWENSRGSRTPREWLDLIDVCQARKVQIFITTHRRLYDLDQWRDRHHLQEESLKAAASSEETSERVIRTLGSNARKGKPHGLIPYGYRRTYTKVRNAKDRLVQRPDAQLPEPAEARHVIELLRAIAAGQSMASIARDWAERGITSRAGAPFTSQTLRQMALKPGYIGMREHLTKAMREAGQPAVVVPAVWPVVADFEGSPITPDAFVELFHQVGRILRDASRTTNPGGGAKHVYTMTIRCDACGGPITVTLHKPMARRGTPVYVCRDKGCTYVEDKAALDSIITGEILTVLSRPDVYAAISPTTGDDDTELAVIRASLSRKRALLSAFEAEDPETPTETRLLGRKIDALETEISELEAQQGQLTRPSPLAGLIEPGPDVATRWAALDVPTQRQIAALLLTTEHLGQVRIVRAPYPEAPAAERLVWATTT